MSFFLVIRLVVDVDVEIVVAVMVRVLGCLGEVAVEVVVIGGGESGDSS